jgi:murein DD-endopeptidase MepM/ murein hydrolase activator NlpD
MIGAMKRLVGFLLLLLILLLLPSSSPGVAAPPQPPSTPQVPMSQVEQAIQAKIATEQELVSAYLLYDTRIEAPLYSEDGSWAIAQLIPVDRQTGYVVPAEPGLALSRNFDGDWQVYLPNDPQWAQTLTEIPDSLVSPDDKATWLSMYELANLAAETTTFTGYKLPWEAGKSLVLTQSISHYNPPNPSGSMHYAFDFAARHDATGTSPMFSLLASKAGRVKYARWWQGNGDPTSPGNYLVIEDTTTSPTSYVLYLHLAQDSIPVELRQAGTSVLQGQYIGMADDTGYSTGNHLHFQVHTNPSSYWGNSVDIVFSDVAINGGRPRTPTEAASWPEYGSQGQWDYISGNSAQTDQVPPGGYLTAPPTGIELGESTLDIFGVAYDNVALGSVQIKANYAGAWHDIGPAFSSSPFNYTWDLCSNQVPNGPVSLALDIRDAAGNTAPGLPGLRHFVKQFACPAPPPSCTPGSSQIALYADRDYSGDCVVLGAGSFTSASLGAVGDNDAASIKIGSLVRATLFINSNFQGRGETFTGNDSSLEDNRIGSDRLSSLLVQTISTLPSTPALVYPANGASFPYGASLSLAWDDAGGGTEFQLKLDNVDYAWQNQPVFHLGSVAQGVHTWQVRSRNSSSSSQWSAASSFTIQGPTALPEAPDAIAPYFDNMESGYNGWSRGEWDQTLDDNATPGGSVSWHYEINDDQPNYNTGAANSGYLTSPSISIPSSGYFLRFWYLYETEGSGTHWDQRWIQLSMDGGPFSNVLQLYDDPANFWQQSPPIDLSIYAGHAIRVRFHFETLDASFNDFRGWFIDDFTIDTNPPPSCNSDGEPDETAASAYALSYGSSVNRQICPQGDADYFRFTGNVGDQIGISSIAETTSLPDTYLFLLDGNFASVLAENDDRYPGFQQDSFLTYRLTRSGTYYIKLRAWNHPSVGGSEYNYTLSLLAGDHTDPQAQILSPMSNAWLPLGNVTISVQAVDPSVPGETASGVSHVDFLWHGGDWENSSWINLGADWDGSDGWSYNIDTSSLLRPPGAAIFVRVYDWAGNWRGTAAWDLRPDNPYKVYLPALMR